MKKRKQLRESLQSALLAFGVLLWRTGYVLDIRELLACSSVANSKLFEGKNVFGETKYLILREKQYFFGTSLLKAQKDYI